MDFPFIRALMKLYRDDPLGSRTQTKTDTERLQWLDLAGRQEKRYSYEKLPCEWVGLYAMKTWSWKIYLGELKASIQCLPLQSTFPDDEPYNYHTQGEQKASNTRSRSQSTPGYFGLLGQVGRPPHPSYRPHHTFGSEFAQFETSEEQEKADSKIKEALYRPLNSSIHEIRLLRLYRRRHGRPLECSLFSISLDDAELDYAALSYVCGDPADRLPIFVDGHQLMVYRNLSNALSGLQSEEKELVIWADAICINQWDMQEKAQQISFMGEIYRKCSKVYCWLGCPNVERAIPPTEKDEEGPSKYSPEDRCLICGSTLDLPSVDGSPPADTARQLMSLTTSNFRTISKRLKQLFRLSKAAWWTRIWTLQEAMLPPTVILRTTDGANLTLLSAASLVDRMLHCGLCKSVLYHPDNRNVNQRDVLDSLLKLDSELATINLMRQPGKLLVMGAQAFTRMFQNRRQATDPRDQVFGTKGMTEPVLSPVPVDYDEDIGVIYVGSQSLSHWHVWAGLTIDNHDWATKGYWRRTNSIRRGLPQRELYYLPSWVCDLNATVDEEIWVYHLCRTREYLFHCRASPKTDSGYDEPKDLTLLRANAWRVGTVIGAINLNVEFNLIDSKIWAWTYMMETFQKMNASESSSQKWQTELLGFLDFLTYGAIRLTYDAEEQTASQQETSSAVETHKRGMNPAFRDQALLLIVDHVSVALRTAIAPQGSAEGDEVYIPSYSTVPFILRPQPSVPVSNEGRKDAHYFAVVGPAWVMGVMNGEVPENENYILEAILIK